MLGRTGSADTGTHARCRDQSTARWRAWPSLSQETIRGLRKLGAELIKIDGEHPRYEYPNGLALADFFDFT
ncbi:hypothetical protein [Burkholderia glumae]|uniref:hypothetical protein n=1 Tax=Burkholderia glumae TaxID=337 RepID=UPI00214F6E8D|nr:hypothetical protein [Burkholderia glumae]